MVLIKRRNPRVLPIDKEEFTDLTKRGKLNRLVDFLLEVIEDW